MGNAPPPRKKGKNKKNQAQRRAEELKKLEQRERKFMEAISEDVRSNRRMLEAMSQALVHHDLTIAAMKAVMVEKGVFDEDEIISKKTAINSMREAAQKRNEEMAAQWQAQVDAMREEGLPPAEIKAIMDEARETQTEPELVRMKRATQDRDIKDESIPEDAFVFGG